MVTDTGMQTELGHIARMLQRVHVEPTPLQRRLAQLGLFSNKALLASVSLTFVLQLAVVYVSFLQEFFKTVALSAADFVLCLALSSVVFCAVEAQKAIVRQRRNDQRPIG